MSRSRFRDWGEEFVPAVHYEFSGTSLCGVTRTRNNKTLLSKSHFQITCKNCIKKLAKGTYVKDHFEKELFTI